jgi:hypothetical protein
MNSPRRHIHLGARLEAAEKVRRGETTARDAAAALGVDEGEVLRWVASGERPLSFDDVLVSPEAQRLTRRAQRLVALISEADDAIRGLTQLLAQGRRGAARGAE